MSTRYLLLLALTAFLLASNPASASSSATDDDDDEDLTFLEDDSSSSSSPAQHYPEYAAAATELKDEKDVALAKVDATEESELSQEHDVQGFPTLYFFVDGVRKPYPRQRTKEAIVTWIKKKIGPGISNVTTLDDAEQILTSESKVALGYLMGYLNSLVVSFFSFL
ncbi:unnamed protein product [Linum trigynum]|uniref:Thioredoxin domain-containing protein n=1 Tax=Linum trigynum TaxID=586398 RepID=A0AAV2D9L5_9ROSI